MSDSLKLSTALPGDDEINGLDSLAEDLVRNPDGMICAVIICDVKDVRYVRDLEAHIPTLRFRRGEAWPLNETPEDVRLAMIERAEQRMGRVPLPFGEMPSKKRADDTKPNPDECDHTDYIIERDHLEDVPAGMFRETCLRCGWNRYQPVAGLPARLEAMDAESAPSLLTVVPDVEDEPDAEPADDGECQHDMEPQGGDGEAVVVERCKLCGLEERLTAGELG